ncbi:M14 family metallopeptidase [Fretibacter rubidus]|uniref:M14 family metallopeptidase n=1 Tax=Fretibacter rubidus TaxID=570162 RepID=UPI00352AE33F
MGFINQSSVFLSVMFLTACASTVVTAPADTRLPASTSAALCENDVAEIRADHPTARLNQCDVLSENAFAFTIRPEAKTDPQGAPINNSAWYGFRVDPKTNDDIRISLKYENGKHRYKPKKSYDGKNWTVISERQLTKRADDHLDLRLKSDGRPFYVSAQEIFTAKAHDNWTAQMAERPFVSASVIGTSLKGYPLQMLDAQTEPNKAKPYVVLVGRQHPPEITGALALMPFTETVLGETDLAKRFREHFNVLIVPMINPDGVSAGHWRFSEGGMDLNRDWGPFSQPETRAVKDAFSRFKTTAGTGGADRVAFFLDFHSTARNLLYTQADDEPTSPPFFARDWVAAVDARLDDDVYAFTREARHNSGRPISKNYMYDTYGISSITYEVGDETNRDAIDLSAIVFAQEMMSLLLTHETGE